MKCAVFLDRDGVINELVYDSQHGTVDSPMFPSQVKLMYGIDELIKDINKTGFISIICSNQPAVALGKTTLKNFKAVTEEIKTQLKAKGASIDYEYHCLHHPFAKIKKYKIVCECRKPKTSLFLKAASEHHIDLKDSWMIGDGVDDIKAGKKAGCKTILLANINATENLRIIENQLGSINPDFIVKNLLEALKIIKENL